MAVEEQAAEIICRGGNTVQLSMLEIAGKDLSFFVFFFFFVSLSLSLSICPSPSLPLPLLPPDWKAFWETDVIQVPAVLQEPYLNSTPLERWKGHT